MSNHIDFSAAQNAVLMPSDTLPEFTEIVSGFDLSSQQVDYSKLLSSYRTSGFQATNFGLSVECINKMLACRAQPISEESREKIYMKPDSREVSNCTIFLGFTSNLISSGLREVFCYLAKYNMIDCIVTTAGGVEEDFIKCLAPTYIGNLLYSFMFNSDLYWGTNTTSI